MFVFPEGASHVGKQELFFFSTSGLLNMGHVYHVFLHDLHTCLYVCIYIYTCIHMYIYMYTYVYIYTYTYIYKYVNIHVYVYV